MQNIVKVNIKDAPAKLSHKFLSDRGFDNFVYLGKEEDSLLRIAVVDDSGELKSIDGNEIHKKKLIYNKKIGYLKDDKL